jgi:hypothetical protein
MLTIEQVHERLPKSESYRTNAIGRKPKKSQLSITQQTKTKNSSRKQNASSNTKGIVKNPTAVSSGNLKQKQSIKRGLKTTKLLLSTEKKRLGKMNLNIRKPVLFDRIDEIAQVQDIHERSSTMTGGNILSQFSHNKQKDGTENGIETQQNGPKSRSRNVSKIIKNPGTQKGKKEVKRTNGKKYVTLKANKDKEANVYLKGKRCQKGPYKKSDVCKKVNVGIKDYAVYPAGAPIHVPVKNTQLVMVYPTSILQDVSTPTGKSNEIDNQGILINLNEGGNSDVTDNTPYCERVKEDNEAVVEAPIVEKMDDKGDNSDKDIMLQEYSAIVKQEPGLSLYTN